MSEQAASVLHHFIFINECGSVYFACPKCGEKSENFDYQQNEPTWATHTCQQRGWRFTPMAHPEKWRN